MNRSGAVGRIARALFGWLFAAAGLIWIFHDLRPSEVWASMRHLRWAWVAPAIAADIVSYVCQGWRWSLLLRPLGPVGALPATGAIYAGLFTNELLPLRAGEVVRSTIVSRRSGVPLRRVFPSIAAERLFDGFWLTLALVLAARTVRLPGNLDRAAEVMGLLVLAFGMLLLGLAWRGRRRRLASSGEPAASPGSRSLGARVGALFRGFLDDLEIMARAPMFFASGIVSAGVLLFQALAFWLVMRACGLPLSLAAGAISLLIVHLGTALPNAPGNIGSYQFFCVVALTLFGIGKTEAAAFSVVVFVLLTFPLWAIGFFALRASGLSLATARRQTAGA